jgi:hypothetical protein
MALNVQDLIEDSKKKRAEAQAAAEEARANADANKSKTKAANNVVKEANSKFNYANSLEPTIVDLEGQIKIYVTRMSRGDKLNAVDQKELDRLVGQYEKVTAAYRKAYDEGNKILDNLPTDAAPNINPTKKQTDAGISPEDTGREATGDETTANVEGQNKALDKQLSQARVYLASLDDAGRLQWAKVLSDAGFPVPLVGSIGNLDTLTAQYTAAVTSAKNYNTTNAELIKQGLLPSVDITGFLTDRTAYINQVKGVGGAGGAGGGSDISQRISDPTQAASVIQGVFESALGREATDKEVSAITKILNDFEQKNPFKTVNGKTTGGLDREQFILDLIKKGSYEGNAKAYPGILGNLSKEISTKKAGKEEKVALSNRQNIIDTAINNGIKLTESQIDGYLQAVKSGKSIDNIQQEIRSINTLGMPDSVKKLIEAGNDLSIILSPYKRAMATSLGINENTIDMNDPTLRNAIGPDKELSLYDFKKAIRADNRWKYSEEANNEVTDMINQVKRDFGFMG